MRIHVRKLAAMVSVVFAEPHGCNGDDDSTRPAAIKPRKADLACGPFSGFVM
jgi:hypothetical protein